MHAEVKGAIGGASVWFHCSAAIFFTFGVQNQGWRYQKYRSTWKNIPLQDFVSVYRQMPRKQSNMFFKNIHYTFSIHYNFQKLFITPLSPASCN